MKKLKNIYNKISLINQSINKYISKIIFQNLLVFLSSKLKKVSLLFLKEDWKNLMSFFKTRTRGLPTKAKTYFKLDNLRSNWKILTAHLKLTVIKLKTVLKSKIHKNHLVKILHLNWIL